MGKLRDKMIADLQLRNYSRKTQTEYIRCVANFAAHFNVSPERLGEDHLRDFLIHLVQVRKASPSLLKMHVAALKFLYRHTLNRPSEVQHIPYPKIPRTLPDIPTRHEISTILDAVTSITYHAIIATAYATGMRISEVCRLHCSGDIDSKRMLIHVRGGKGAKDRYVLLSQRLLLLLRKYWTQRRPTGRYLFPGNAPDQPIAPASVYRVFCKAVKSCHIPKRITLHTLRHCFATHLMEQGVDCRVIQALLGHASIRTTTRYAHVSTHLIRNITSPFDLIADPLIEPKD